MGRDSGRWRCRCERLAELYRLAVCAIVGVLRRLAIIIRTNRLDRRQGRSQRPNRGRRARKGAVAAASGFNTSTHRSTCASHRAGTVTGSINGACCIIFGRDRPSHASAASRRWRQVIRGVSAGAVIERVATGLVCREGVFAISVPISMVFADRTRFRIWVIELACAASLRVSFRSFVLGGVLEVGQLLDPCGKRSPPRCLAV